MNTVVNIQANLVWRWGKAPRTGLYLASCEAIKQTVQADTWSDLLSSINEVLDSTLREVMESGDLDKFLRDHGWHATNLPTAAARGKRNRVTFDVPFDLRGVPCRDLEKALCS